MRWGSERTLRGRVAWIAGVTAVISALSTAALIGALSVRLALRQEDRRVDDVLRTLAFDLREAGASEAAVRRLVDDEQREVAHTGVRLLVFRGPTRVAGEAAVPHELTEGCATIDGPLLVRACVRREGAYTLVGRAALPSLEGFRRSVLWAAVAALASVAVLAIAASRRAARVALAPLEALRDDVARVRGDAPSVGALAQPQPYGEIEALRAALVELITRLQESLAQARRFAFNAAHELRTPLTALLGAIELSRERADSPAMQQLDALSRELAGRLERVLVLANADAPPPGEPVAFETLVHDVLRGLRPEEAARVTLETDEEGLVRGDPLLLQMLLRNAVENALKFSAGLVHVAIEADTTRVRVFVHDEGEGLDGDEAQRAFEPFHRGLRARRDQVPGSGLGLALIAHVAAMHGGSARFARAERGARLEIELPSWRARSPVGDEVSEGIH